MRVWEEHETAFCPTWCPSVVGAQVGGDKYGVRRRAGWAWQQQGRSGEGSHSLKTQLRTWQRQTYLCTGGELGTEAPLLVKLRVLMGFACLRNLLCGGSCTFTLGLGLSWRLLCRARLSLILCRESTCAGESC